MNELSDLENLKQAMLKCPVTLRDLKALAIVCALERSGGNVSKAARYLGWGRTTLHRFLRGKEPSNA